MSESAARSGTATATVVSAGHPYATRIVVRVTSALSGVLALT